MLALPLCQRRSSRSVARRQLGGQSLSLLVPCLAINLQTAPQAPFMMVQYSPSPAAIQQMLLLQTAPQAACLMVESGPSMALIQQTDFAVGSQEEAWAHRWRLTADRSPWQLARMA